MGRTIQELSKVSGYKLLENFMSTRCQIGFYSKRPAVKDLLDFKALIYRHSDGYPDTEHGVLWRLVPFLKKFKKARGLDDTEYASARTLQHLTNEYDKQAKTYSTEPQYIGYGVSQDFHDDIEFIYAVHPEGVDVYETVYDSAVGCLQVGQSKLVGGETF